MGKAHSKTARLRSKSQPNPTDPHIQEVIIKRKYSSSYALPLDNDENLQTDIVNNYPQSIKPENTTFIRANVINGLPFADNTFDFVYMRFMMLAFSLKNWPQVINEMTRVCKPGGWIEVMERDILWFNEGEVVHNWRTKIVEGMREKGIELIISPYISNFFKANEQLINFKSDERIEPLGAWAGIIGKAYSQVIMWGAKNLTHAVSGIQFEEGEYGELINVAMDELNKNQSFDKSHRFWAMKKPL
ncbi:7777_t:CDS:2 [Diversispora eburnea]|uniref:7777_t:CDS:1 n=1 Tax=Diversispora eburnea TaxID=1213867 RepID=A0A9N8UZQ2_9GLOM|nr:7777_t:CDS:2 [Diversispora eburnea]